VRHHHDDICAELVLVGPTVAELIIVPQQVMNGIAATLAKRQYAGWTRIGRYNQMLRYFVRFLQERAILRELANDYDYWFEAALGMSAGPC
jgi:hypothetical protein